MRISACWCMYATFAQIFAVGAFSRTRMAIPSQNSYTTTLLRSLIFGIKIFYKRWKWKYTEGLNKTIEGTVHTDDGDDEGFGWYSKQIIYVLMHYRWKICTPVICIVARQGLSHHEKVQVFSHSNSKQKPSKMQKVFCWYWDSQLRLCKAFLNQVTLSCETPGQSLNAPATP